METSEETKIATDQPNIKPTSPSHPLGSLGSFKFTKWVVISLVLLIVMLLAVWLYFIMKGPKAGYRHQVETTATVTAPSAEQAAMQAAVVETEQQTQALLALLPVQFPKVSSSTAVAPSSIPASLMSFALASSTNLQTLAVTFDNGTKGLRLIYDLKESIPVSQGQLLSLKGWTMDKAVYSNQAGAILMHNPKLEVQIIQTFLDAGHTRISVIGRTK